MATVVDTLITRYKLDPSGYKSGAAEVESATSGLASSMAALGGPLGITIASLTALAAVEYKLGVAAVKAGIEFDTLSRQMTAVTGSADRTAQILRFIDQLAIPSMFQTNDLAEAAKLLEAFGLRTELYLPVIEKLGSVFGGTAGDIQQFANALGMIKSGRTGEGLEALARAGISRNDLKARGLTFDKGGAFTGDIGALLTAVRAITNARLGSLSKEMASSPAAKLASISDQWDKALRNVGQTLLTKIMPHVESISQMFESFIQKGYVDKIGDGLSSWITKLELMAQVTFGPFMKLAELLGFDLSVGAAGNKLANRLMNADAYNAEHGLGPYAGQSTPPAVESESVRYLRAIESNTAPIREMMSYIFGGGELGKSGASISSVKGASHVRRARQMRSMGVILA